MAKQDAQISFRATKEFKQELEERARQERLSASGLILKVLQAYLHPEQEGCGSIGQSKKSEHPGRGQSCPRPS